jgi:hypothetical protein
MYYVRFLHNSDKDFLVSHNIRPKTLNYYEL